MNKILSLCALIFLVACSPIKSPIAHQYKIGTFSTEKLATNKSRVSILISQPDAIAGYQTEQMLYTIKPYQLSAFAHSSWISSPANMIYPLIVLSLQHSHYFSAVASGPNSDKTDYRLDTQLIALQQNFLVHPSRIELVIQAVLTHIEDNRVVASSTFNEHVTCKAESPYGGVVAANIAARQFTNELSKFIVEKVAADEQTTK